MIETTEETMDCKCSGIKLIDWKLDLRKASDQTVRSFPKRLGSDVINMC